MDSTAEPMVNPNRFYTYAYLREDKTPYYIGKGQGRRMSDRRKKDIKPPKDKSKIIFLKKNLTEKEAFKHEIYMIDVFGRKDLGTGTLRNRTNGGDGASGAIRSDETRKKISEVNKNKILSEETKKKISDANKGRILSEETRKRMKGRIFSEETKKKMSEARKNFSEETRKRFSEARKGAKNPNYGKTTSEETKKKISEALKGAKHPNYGKTASAETKKKISEGQKGRIHSSEARKRMSETRKGEKWWNDGCGNCKLKVDCPGDDWKLGRK